MEKDKTTWGKIKNATVEDDFGDEDPTYKCCGKTIKGAMAFHKHLKSPFHIEQVVKQNKMFHNSFASGSYNKMSTIGCDISTKTRSTRDMSILVQGIFNCFNFC